MFRVALRGVHAGRIGKFSTTVVTRLSSLSVPARIGYAVIGAAIVCPSKSFCDTAALQPVVVDVPAYVHKQELIKKGEASFMERVYDTLEKIGRFLRNIVRVGTYCMYLSPLAILGPSYYYLHETYPNLEETLWDYLIWSVEKLGPTFIKLAQWASTRPDLFPPELTNRLEKLQDQVNGGASFAHVERTMEEAFGPKWKEWVEMEQEPIGCGCVAQVYRGRLLRNASSIGVMTATSAGSPTSTDDPRTVVGKGTPVAVKLIHPHVERLVRQDMELLGNIGDLLDQFAALEIISLGDMIREFGTNLYKQLDLRVEGYHLKKFQRNFHEDGDWAEFPKPVDELTHKNVLVETLMTGQPISDFMKLGDGSEHKALKMKLSDLCTRTLVKMIFFDNYIHGDLHPGNILVRFDKKGDPILGFLDCGIVYSTSSEEEHDNLMHICKYFIKHDGRTAGKYIIKSAKNYSAALPDGDYRKKRQVLEEEKFCEAMQDIVNESEKQSYFEHMSEYIDRICNMAYKHNVKLDAEHFHVFMALKVAEGISLSFNRELDIISTALPMITKAETMRRLGVFKFPLPDHAEETLVNESAKV